MPCLFELLTRANGQKEAVQKACAAKDRPVLAIGRCAHSARERRFWFFLSSCGAAHIPPNRSIPSSMCPSIVAIMAVLLLLLSLRVVSLSQKENKKVERQRKHSAGSSNLAAPTDAHMQLPIAPCIRCCRPLAVCADLHSCRLAGAAQSVASRSAAIRSSSYESYIAKCSSSIFRRTRTPSSHSSKRTPQAHTQGSRRCQCRCSRLSCGRIRQRRGWRQSS